MPAITVDALSERERAEAEARDYSEPAPALDAPVEAPEEVQDQVASQFYQEVQGPEPVDAIESPAEEEFVPVADSLPEYNVDAPPPRPAGSTHTESPVAPPEPEPIAPEEYHPPPETEPVSPPALDTLSEQTEDAVTEVGEAGWSPESFTEPPVETAQEAEPVAAPEPEPDVTPTVSEAPAIAEPSFVPDPVPSDASALDEPSAPPWGSVDEAGSEVASEYQAEGVGAQYDVEPAPVAPDAPEPESALQQPHGLEDDQEIAPLPDVMPDAGDGTSVGASEGDVVLTETMAEVYAAQGLTHQAREVYRALLASNPGNATLEAGLAALEESGVAKVADTEPEVAVNYAAALTGGTNVKAFLAEVLAARPYSLDVDLDSESTGDPDRDLDAPTAMDTAFAEDEREDAEAAPARPAEDEMSLASVFGDEAPQGEPGEINAVPGGSAADEPSSDMSFDQFFGTAAPSTADESPAVLDESATQLDESPVSSDESPPAEPDSQPEEDDAGEDDDEDFKAWLKSLKS
jgi:hypothetical protein